MAKKISKSEKIRNLLAHGMSVAQIAKKLDVSPNYVYAIRWNAANKKNKAKVAKANGKAKVKEDKKIPEVAALAKELAKMDEEFVAARTPAAVRWNAANKKNKAKMDEELADEEFVAARYPADDKINAPEHYTVGGIEVWDYIAAKELNYNLGNVVKYVSRADYKSYGNDYVEDLQKARAYLDREIKQASTI